MSDRQLEHVTISRRVILHGLVAAVVPAASSRLQAAQPATTAIGPLDAALLPRGVRSRFVDGVNGLRAGGTGYPPRSLAYVMVNPSQVRLPWAIVRLPNRML